MPRIRRASALLLSLAVAGCESGAPEHAPRGAPPTFVSPRATAGPVPATSDAASQNARAALESKPKFVLTPKSNDYTPSFPKAIVAASERAAAAGGRAKTGDGCRATRVVQAQGYRDEAHVTATLEFLGKRLKMSIVNVETGASVGYRGTLDQSMCDHAEEGDLLGLGGYLDDIGKKLPRLTVSVARYSYMDVNRERLHLEGTAEGDTMETLNLLETFPARVDLRNRYQTILKTNADVEAVLRGPRGTELLVFIEADTRKVFLAELLGSPPRLGHKVETGLSCTYHRCDGSLYANEVLPGVVVLVPVIEGEMCGAKCSNYAEGEIWTLTSDGFQRASKLPSTEAFPGGLTYDSSSSLTQLDWVEGDGTRPREILVRHTARFEDKTSFLVLGWDPVTKTFSKWEDHAPLDYDTLRPLLLGQILGF